MSEAEGTIILSPPSPDLFRIGNLEFQVKNDLVLTASAMPELENRGEVLIPNTPTPFLWRGWVVAVGPGIHLTKAAFTFNPGIEVGDYVYFPSHIGRFFSFDNISFVFVKMQDIVMTTKV